MTKQTAHIIPFPGALAAPVVNPQRKAPYNNTVRPIKLGKLARTNRLMRERYQQAEYDKQKAEYEKQREFVGQVRNALWAAETRLELLALAMPATAKAVHHV